MLLHPVIFYNGTCAAPGRRWREHTAVIPQVVRENSARQVDLVPGKTRLLLLLLNPTPSASSFCRQQVVNMNMSLGFISHSVTTFSLRMLT